MREYLVALPAPESVLGRLCDELAVRIGRVAIASEAVQDYIGHLYLELQGGDTGDRKAAQEKLKGRRSDVWRREITEKAIQVVLAPHPTLCERGLELLKWAEELSTTRNEAIHNVWVFTAGGQIEPSSEFKQPNVDADWQRQFDNLVRSFREIAYEFYPFTSTVADVLAGHLMIGPSILDGTR